MAELFGPFKQILTLGDIPMKGSVSDKLLTPITNGGIIIEDGKITRIGSYNLLKREAIQHHPIEEDLVLLPGLIDCHTHLIWGGSRARDYALRMSGGTYEEILAKGGGIFDSVNKTVSATDEELSASLGQRANRHLSEGVTTIEVKTGYGLLPDEELRLLRIIKQTGSQLMADLIPTCLAAHVCPKGMDVASFLDLLVERLLPELVKQKLTDRVDIFIEKNAFSVDVAKPYLLKAKQYGFKLAIHADQFSTGGSALAIALGASSADHLEASGSREVNALAASEVMAVVLPGASLGLGIGFAPTRKLLDAGAGLAIATDWNPGSGPMGDLLLQASILGMYEKLSSAELFAGITFRAAKALELHDRGRLVPGMLADMVAFPTGDYREIFYHQGKMKPTEVWKRGEVVHV